MNKPQTVPVGCQGFVLAVIAGLMHAAFLVNPHTTVPDIPLIKINIKMHEVNHVLV